MPRARCRWSEPLANERGSTTVLVALTLPVLLGMGAVVLDGSLLYLERARLQAAVDGAALAAARTQALEGEAEARRAARAVIEADGLDPDLAAIDLRADGSARVVYEAEVPARLSAFLGFGPQAVPAAATAAAGPPGEVTGAQPWGVEDASFSYGERVALKLSPHSDASPSYPGNFHALALGGRGAGNYEENVTEGYPGVLAVGDVIETEPGNMAGPTRRGLEERLSRDPDATFETVSAGSPRLILVPLVDFEGAHGRSEVTIVGFAAFFLEGLDEDGAVYGRFLRRVIAGAEREPGAPDRGLYAVQLVE